MGEERRKAKRVDVNAEIELKALSGDKGSDTRNVEVGVLDISSGGLAFACSEQLQMDEFFNTSIKIEGCDRIKAVVQIVRSSVNEDGAYVYGSRFVGMNDEDKFRISVFQMVNDSKGK